MNRRLLYFYALCMLTTSVRSQYIYPEKFGNYSHLSFCLDCGDVPMKLPQDLSKQLSQYFNVKHKNNTNGYLRLQILIDTIGQPFLISALNETNVSSSKLNLPFAIHDLDQWTAAKEKGRKTNSVVTLGLEFKNGVLTDIKKIPPFNQFSFMRSVGKTVVVGTHPSRLSESWHTYIRHNSALPWDMCRALAKDKNNTIWIGTDNGLVRIAGSEWKIFDKRDVANNFKKQFGFTMISDIVVDSKNNKWLIYNDAIIKYDDQIWTVYDSLNLPIQHPEKLYADHLGNVWITSVHGLCKFDGTKWTLMNKRNSSLPNDTIKGIFVDSKSRLWVGTSGGSIMIDGKNSISIRDIGAPEAFDQIIKMEEDKAGHLYVHLQTKKSEKSKIYILKTSGIWESLVKKRSDILDRYPIRDFLIDNDRMKLWFALEGVGIVKYDPVSRLHEIYNHTNSNVFSVNVIKLIQDKGGMVWAATLAGVSKTTNKRPAKIYQ